jgi:hypothetical protein
LCNKKNVLTWANYLGCRNMKIACSCPILQVNC